MKKIIYKYEIKIQQKFIYNLPVGYKILHIDLQNGVPHMWILIDADNKKTVDVEFLVYGTGHEIHKNCEMNHIGTFLEGIFVWHVFETKFYCPEVE